MPVYKTKQEATKDGKKWYFMVSYKDIYGNKKRYKSCKYDKQGEAEDAEAIFRTSYKLEPSNTMTFEELKKLYINHRNIINKESTMYSNESIIENYMSKYFNDKKINDITELGIKKWKDIILKNKFSINYNKKIYMIMNSIFKYGVNQGYLIKNVVTMAGGFIDKKDKVVNEEEIIRFITPKEYFLFESVIDDVIFKTFFAFLFWTGCRKGEVQALNWNDIDFNNEIIRINKTLTVKTKNGSFNITNTKNRKNRRIEMPLPLKEHLLKLYEHYKSFDNFEDKWFVFGGVRHLPQTTIDKKRTKYYNLVDEKYTNQKFNRITNHEFRHSHASLLISNGINMELIAERLGDTVNTVRNTYAHLFKEKKKEVKNLLNSVPNMYLNE